MNSIGDIMKGGISAILIALGYVVLWCGIILPDRVSYWDGQWARDALVRRRLRGLCRNSDGLRHRLVLHSKAKGLNIGKITGTQLRDGQYLKTAER